MRSSIIWGPIKKSGKFGAPWNWYSNCDTCEGNLGTEFVEWRQLSSMIFNRYQNQSTTFSLFPNKMGPDLDLMGTRFCAKWEPKLHLNQDEAFTECFTLCSCVRCPSQTSDLLNHSNHHSIHTNHSAAIHWVLYDLSNPPPHPTPPIVTPNVPRRQKWVKCVRP